MRNAVGAGLGEQQIDVPTRAGRTGGQQNGLIVRLLCHHFGPLAAADHLRFVHLRLKQPGKWNIQRYAERPQRFQTRVAVSGLQLR
ncbi:Uncharacterised protein [Klebsiella pneumoniae]|nr:Uncharacterised protein [Klebsiella pneumoniae]